MRRAWQAIRDWPAYGLAVTGCLIMATAITAGLTVRTPAPAYRLPSWLQGASCTPGEARDLGVTRADCVNLVGTRLTITITRGPAGGIRVVRWS